MLKLTVKNFGVLKNIDIELNKTNLFIGDNGSGKSVLAKLITIITSYDNYSDTLLEEFSKFDINFIENDTFIEHSDNNKIILSIKNKKIDFAPETLKTLASISKANNILKSFSNPDNIFIDNLLPKFFISQYIPAERNLISLLNKSIFSLFSADIPLPKNLMNFAGEYEKAKKSITELDLLNMKYMSKNGQDRIYYNDINYLPLENSSSGIQTALPLYLTLKYFNEKHYHSVVIEEPELNLYPKSQIDTVKFMIENREDSSLSIMTHSPYILSILNVLIFAYKASSNNDILKEKISTIIPQTQHINPDEFSAYLIEDGTSTSIKGKSTGMIQSNVIDDISDMLDDDYNELMEIYREFKSDK